MTMSKTFRYPAEFWNLGKFFVKEMHFPSVILCVEVLFCLHHNRFSWFAKLLYSLEYILPKDAHFLEQSLSPLRLVKLDLEAQFNKFLNIHKKICIKIPFAEALSRMPLYAKFLKEIFLKKKAIENNETITLTMESSAIIKKPPPKLRDSGSFAIPCMIGSETLERALCDLGASISLFPLSLFKRMGIGELKPTETTLKLADRSTIQPIGYVEDIPIKIEGIYIPTDFMVLDIDEDNECPIILGRPFLATAGAIVDVNNGRIVFQVSDGMGVPIHIVTQYRDLEHWKALLEDNKTYVLHNCLVFDNDAAFKYVDHPFNVVLGPGSKVTRNDKLTDIPSHEFKFKSFKEIENGNLKPDVLYDNGKPNICNNWSGTKMFMNLKHPVVERFMATSSRRSQNDEFSNLAQVRHIGEFRDFIQNIYCITIGRTKKFNPNQFGCYYESCPKCPRSWKSNGAGYRCGCREDVEVPFTSLFISTFIYKVVVQVVYEGQKADFVFWDKECVQILGVIADTLRKTMQEIGEDDPIIYPKHLDNLLNLQLALHM
ncbi:retropepsins domain protein, putative [Medicago truncatula]|uniref:Retropepsins domain protein, putative n=1 Tax=Medicago truncatula TaxID=3880 RepID=A0A072TQW9_MEDTR|nr:retropepsins domain protein, putative [Medicago truncatula]